MHHFYLFYPNGYVTLNDNEYILGIPFTTQFDKTLYCIKYYKVHNHHRTMDLQNAFHSSTWPSSNGRLLWADLAHWGQDQMAAISQTTMSNAFSWKKMLGFRLKFHWSFFPKGRINNIPSLVWLGAYQATSHYLNRWWLDYRRIYASLGLNELKRKLLHISTLDTKNQFEQGQWRHNI